MMGFSTLYNARRPFLQRCIVTLLAISALCAGLAALAQEPPPEALEMPGFKPEVSYQNFGNGESVNLGNGGLTVSHRSVIALPQNMGDVLCPTRVYNSKNIEDCPLPRNSDHVNSEIL